MGDRFDPKSLEHLRQWRTPTPRDLTPKDTLHPIIKDLKKSRDQMGNLGEAWAVHVPSDLLATSELISLMRGVLTVQVRDASSRFALDRWLRDGGQQDLISVANVPLRRIKLI
jgi:hypothetical protein